MTYVTGFIQHVTSYMGWLLPMYESGLIRDFSNIGLATPARLFPGFPARSDTETKLIAPRGCEKVDLKTGDLLSLRSSETATALVVAIDVSGADGSALLGLSADTSLVPRAFDAARLGGWLQARGQSLGDHRAARVPVEDLGAFAVTGDCTVWIAAPSDSATLVDGTAAASILLEIKRSAPNGTVLPEPLGEIRDEFTVPRGTALAYEVAAGELVQIIDVEGQQCSDFTAFRADALRQGDEVMIDSTATRSMVRQPYPSPGLLDKFFDRDMAPMLRVVQDTCGRHDTFGLACTARSYEDRGFPGHLNCSDNMSEALDPFGVVRRAAWPAVNFFWNTWIDPNTHQILTEESHSRPGDYVVMEAQDHLVCVSTACPGAISVWRMTIF